MHDVCEAKIETELRVVGFGVVEYGCGKRGVCW